jgi:hypothetical protein
MTTIGPAPPGYQRLKILQPLEYAREILPPDSIAVVDDSTADRWISARLAVPAPAPAIKTISTYCPRCQSPMTFPEFPEPGARWTECKNANCRHGWLR